jgi:hypothetical protein
MQLYTVYLYLKTALHVSGNTSTYHQERIQIYQQHLVLSHTVTATYRNKMQLYTIYLYLKTALHVSGGTSTHHQERIQLYLQHLVLVTPLLLPTATRCNFTQFIYI